MAAPPYLSEIRIFASGVVPKGWVPCNGQLLPIAGNADLFYLIGTTYGGDNIHNFAVPNLNGRVPMQHGINFPAGVTGGEETHALSINEMPEHNHLALASQQEADSNTPQNNWWAVNPEYSPYSQPGDTPNMSPQALQAVGANKQHNNMSPYLALNICMAVSGIYPSPDDTILMTDPYISEIRILACKFAPGIWSTCEGQKLPVPKYVALYSLIGNIYGGDAQTFNVPDMRVAALISTGQGPGLKDYKLGDKGGASQVAITEETMPRHTHAAYATDTGTQPEPSYAIWANPASVRPYPNFYATKPGNNPYQMDTACLGWTGRNAPHNNLMPYTVVNYVISTGGTMP